MSVDFSAWYALPFACPCEVALVSRWIDRLPARGCGVRVVEGVANIAVYHPTVGARAILDVAFAGPNRPQILARLWALPSCVADLAQDFGLTVSEVRAQVDALAAAGLVYEVGGVWRARPMSRAGEA
jgi:DNA-binding transcriptional ArsR family regulator